MKDLVEKLSSYNLFNYLLPGAVFVVITSVFTNYSFVQGDIVLGFFFYYFLGLVVSRFGSLVLEPILRRVRFVHYGNYSDFIAASKEDSKLEALSEANNMYRTLASLFLLLLMLKGYERLVIFFPVVDDWSQLALVVGLLFMFLMAYRKQNEYVARRISAISKEDQEA